MAREARKDEKRLWRSQGNAREEGAIEKVTANGDHNSEDKPQGEGNRKDPLSVLDVGSCYNPFGELEGWQVKIMCIIVALNNLEFLILTDFVVHV